MAGEFTIVTITEHTPIKGKDRIVSSFVNGEIIVINKDDNPIGSRGLLFDCETKLNGKILEDLSLYREPSLNKNPDKTGFFSDDRVRPQIFAGCKCSGFFLNFSQISHLPYLKGMEKLEDGHKEYSYNGFTLSEKWVPKVTQEQQANKAAKKIRKKYNRILPNQFSFHKKTSHFGDILAHIKPTDMISISHKLHGTSFICGNVLCRKQLNPILKLVTLGLYRPVQYENIYSSRSVIKSMTNQSGFYKEDIWRTVNEQIKENIPKGISVYGEITGFAGQSPIQKNYDYGSQQGDYKYWIYRVVDTDKNGVSHDFSTQEILDFCADKKYNTVPYIYHGQADLWFSQQTENYGRGLFDHLTDLFLEKDCDFCHNQVPAEGVVIRLENIKGHWSAFKLKSFAFRMIESKQETVDIETEN